MKFKINKNQFLWWICIIFFTSVRLVNLNWGTPYYFHPDERNVASAITTVINNFETSENVIQKFETNFYAYGGVPIYLISILVYFTSKHVNQDIFALAILWGRIISIIWSIVTILYIYKIAKLIQNGWWLKLVIFLSVTCFGFIQFARYGTFEMWLTGLGLMYLYQCVRISNSNSIKNWIFASIIIGIMIGTKVPSLTLLPLISLSGLVYASQKNQLRSIKLWGKMLILQIFSTAISIIIVFVSNPLILNHDTYQVSSLYDLYAGTIMRFPGLFTETVENFHYKVGATDISQLHTIFDQSTFEPILQLFNPSFVHSMNVESAIARGDLQVFYTRHFVNTVPILYHFTHILPWLMSFPMIITGILGFILILWSGYKFKSYVPLIIIIWWFLQANFIFSLYVKWTRYLVPLLPIFIWGGSWFWAKIRNLYLSQSNRLAHYLLKSAFVTAWTIHVLFSLMLITTLFNEDTRIQASNWVTNNNINSNWRVLSEVYDLGIVPMNGKFRQIDLFNFYDLDDQSDSELLRSEFYERINHYELLIIPSRRIWYHTLQNPTKFPQASNIYDNILNDKSNFTKLAEFNNYPRLGPIKIDDESMAEETFSVFDRPRVQIYIRKDLVDQDHD